MKRRLFRVTAILLTVIVLSSPMPVRAQSYDYLVYDESNWQQAVRQVEQLYQLWEQAVLQVEQLQELFKFFQQQARRLPVNMASRYRGQSADWTFHDPEAGLYYADPMIDALNGGDPTGAAYRRSVDPLDRPTDAVARMPASLQRRLTNAYAAIEMADSVSEVAVDQLGSIREAGPRNLRVAQDMETDAVSTSDAYNTQTALLNKINTNAALNLRFQDHMTKSLVSTVEQLLVSNQRQRDAEAILINATIYQWRHGQAYGQNLFRNTAAALDGWRQR